MPKLYGLPRLKLHHQQGTNFAPSKIKPDGAFAVGVEWPEAEVEKYEEYCNASANSTAPKSALSADDKASKIPVPPYTIAEKEWLKHRSGHKDEFHFLRAYSLSIYDDEDREEGRLIVRGFMAHDTEDGDDDSEEERNAMGHQVDYAFTVEQLNFLEKGRGTAENFLLALRLKSCDVEDLKLGMQILLRLMASRS